MRKVLQILLPIIIFVVGILPNYAAANVDFSNYSWLGKAPIGESKIKAILALEKGSRPDPKTYLPQKYIWQHLKQFRQGVSIIMSRESYYKFVADSPTIGRDDGCFVMPKKVCDDIAKVAKGDAAIFEKALSFDAGYFSEHGGIIRIDVSDIGGLHLRIPSGNETAVNYHWIPGGYTKSGIPEAVCDKIPKSRATIIK